MPDQEANTVLDTADTPLARTLEGAWYTDAALFEREQQAIFGHRWVCVALGSDLPAPGSFITATVAGESVIVLRGDDGRLAAFFNVCRHRGSRLLLEPSGVCRRLIRCPYHAWAYGLDGALRAAPNLRGFSPSSRLGLGLVPLAVEEMHGCVWVNLAEQPTAFDDDVGRQIRGRMGSDDLLATWRLDQLATGRRVVYDVAANWKLIVENFSECYHCGTVHPELTTIIPEFRRGQGTLHQPGYGAAYGDRIEGSTVDGRPGLPPLPGLAPDDHRRYYGLVLVPNVFLNLFGDHAVTHWLEPLAPDRTRVTCVWLFAADTLAGDSDLEPTVELFGRTNLQDFAAVERCQLGMTSRIYRVGGHLVPIEDTLRDFHDEVRAALADADASTHPTTVQTTGR